MRFADTVLLDLAIACTAVVLEFGFTIDADKSLIFSLPEVYLSRPKIDISGPGGIPVTFAFQAAKPTASAMLTAVLKNDIASYA
jgi:hypothetical protein